MSKIPINYKEEQRKGLLQATLTEADIGQSQLTPTIQETLLVEDEAPRFSVGSWYLFLLTCCLGGLQTIWTLILANGSPFLTSIGLSKALTALVWIAAPLCGTIAQPLIGILGDRNQSRFGRRRPFILGGSIGIAVSVLSLAWTPELVHTSFGAGADNDNSQTASIFLAIFWIYVLNISIQLVQSGSRALLIEACPVHQQEQASAWANVTAGGWNIFGYLCGFTALPELFSTHLSQFQCLSLIASISMLSTALVTCLSIHESLVPQSVSTVSTTLPGVIAMWDDLKSTYQKMPRKIRRVCLIQFWAWMGRFPFLFYSTTYVAEFYQTHKTPVNPSSPSTTTNSQTLTPDSIRHGTFANFLFAIVAFIFSIIFPYLFHLSQHQSHSNVPPISPWLSLARAWSISHILWAFLTFTTFFISTPTSATMQVASLGLSWAVTQWVPFAIIGKELALTASTIRQQRAAAAYQYGDGEDEHYDGLTTTTFSDAIPGVQAAAVMGIHNAAISAPQVVAALLCSFVFSVVRAMRWDDGTAWVMRVGGVASLGAAWLSWGGDF